MLWRKGQRLGLGKKREGLRLGLDNRGRCIERRSEVKFRQEEGKVKVRVR